MCLKVWWSLYYSESREVFNKLYEDQENYSDLEHNYPAEYSRDLIKVCSKCNVYLLVANHEKFANLCQW